MLLSLQIPEFVLGENAALDLPDHLQRMKIERPLVITDRGLVKVGHVARLMEAYGRDKTPACFDSTRENPTAHCVDQATRLFIENGCDGVIALGGGSVIDTAKLTAVTATHGGSALEYLGQSQKITNKTCPIIAIPTTAGTGSEASPGAGIHPSSTEVSRGISSRFVVPRLAICDPSFTQTLPPSLIAATGLDALSHCIEGYLATGEHPFVDMIALEGIRIIRHDLRRAVEVNDLHLRAQMMLAAFYGGVAIGKGLGAAHSIAISCGDQDLHHGVLSALGLVATLDVLEVDIPDRCHAIKQALGLDHRASLSAYIRSFLQSLDLPTSLSAAGYALRDLDALSLTCSESHFNRTSRVTFRPADFSKMVQSIL